MTAVELRRPIPVEKLVNFLNGLIWSEALIALCLGAGLYFSLRTRFLQVRHVPLMLRLLLRGKSSARGISSYQAFALAISGRVGIGNIAGVATAIAMGGPGAIFWMWAIAFLGAGSAFVEATLAQIYKEDINGQYRGGPAYYIERGLGVKWYAVVFAVSTTVATGFFMPGVQANAIGEAMHNAFGLPLLVSAVVVGGLIALIIFGGVKRISRTAEVVVPLMAAGYLVMAAAVVVLHAREVPGMILLIVRSAFGAEAAFGGILGLAISWGVKRGIYSNEAGQGSAPMAAAAAEVKHPAAQGLVQAFSVYVDTWLVCTATALMILLTGKYNVANPAGGFLHEALPGETAGPGYTQAAIDTVVPGFGSAFVAIALFFFAFTTLMAYYYYAETNLAYLRRGKTGPKLFLLLRLVFVGVTFYGTLRHADMAWAMGDVGVGLMAWLNLIAILLLAKPAIACLRDYEAQRRAGVAEPRYVAKRCGVANAEQWKE
jgi:AGCS family alanine or glycine:cation symporter